MTFLYANRLKLCMRIEFNVGDSNCRRNDFDVCESTKVVSAKRPRCMRIDLYANRLVCETTDIRLQWFNVTCLWADKYNVTLIVRVWWVGSSAFAFSSNIRLFPKPVCNTPKTYLPLRSNPTASLCSDFKTNPKSLVSASKSMPCIFSREYCLQ